MRYLVAVFVVIFLAGCLNSDPQLRMRALTENDTAACAMIRMDHMREDCYARVAPRVNATDLCYEIHDVDERNRCLTGVAESADRPDLCENVSVRWQRINCYLGAAKKWSKLEVCENLEGEYLESCKRGVGASSGDPSICESMKDPVKKDLCFYDLSQRLNDTLMCERIESDPQQYKCYYRAGIKYEDPLVCDDIDNQTYIDTCKWVVAKNTYNVSLCNTTDDYGRLRYICYRYFMLRENESTYCGNIYNDSFRDSCYSQYVSNSFDLEGCDKIESGERSAGCYSWFAQRTQNEEVCDRIEERDDRIMCAVKVSGNSSLCEKVEDPIKSRLCY